MKPGNLPIDVMFIIVSVITAAAAAQAAGGLDYLVGLAAKFLRKHPAHITYLGAHHMAFLSCVRDGAHQLPAPAHHLRNCGQLEDPPRASAQRIDHRSIAWHHGQSRVGSDSRSHQFRPPRWYGHRTETHPRRVHPGIAGCHPRGSIRAKPHRKGAGR